MAPATGPDPLPIPGSQPLAIVISACLLGEPVGYDGSSWPSDLVARIARHPRVVAIPFCPETHVLGVPRRWMSIHGGDGFAVLERRATVLNVDGEDLTDAFREGADALLALARERGAQLAILTDVSPMCGSSVIYRGEALPERAYQASSGVGAAALRRAGIPVISQRDAASLQSLLASLDPTFTPDRAAADYVQDPWYVQTFVDPPVLSPEPVFEAD